MSATAAVSVRKRSWTTTKTSSRASTSRIRRASGSETSGFVALIQKKPISPSSMRRTISMTCVGGPSCGMWSGSTFQTRARSATCAGLAQLRKPGRSPLAPVSRVFCAVGWPFIWSTPQPGRPSVPRRITRLLTWQAAAVAWWAW